MKNRRFSRITILLVCVCIALFGLLAGTLATRASAQPTSLKTSSLFDSKPLWQYAKHISATSPGIPPCLNSAVVPRCYSPQQLRTAYNIQPLLDAGFTGKDRTIVLIEGSGSPTLTADVHLYDLLYGLKDPYIQTFAPFGVPKLDTSAYLETALDVETAHALAPDAAIDIVVADVSNVQQPGDFLVKLLGATKYAVDHELGSVISQSFGVGESCVTPAYVKAEQAVFTEAREKHITVLASAGDSGAASDVCQGNAISIGQGVSLPASDPLVTSVGGTTLNASLNSGTYGSETTWNESTVGAGATGGGFSTLFPTPGYQKGVSGTHTTRGVPDVAFDADPLTGVPVVVSLGGSTLIVPVGGTSVGSPAWAAIVAIANQYAGKRLGFLNDAFYKISKSASYGWAFHDITTGNNTVTFSAYDKNGKVTTITFPGYNAGPGWDAVTGVGTPNVRSLVKQLAQLGQGDS